VPFAWSTEPTTAVLAASRSIPLETTLDRWNLPALHLWWHFEEPLPWHPSEPSCPAPIKALSLGWIDNMFGVSTWIVDAGLLQPSQSQWWRRGETMQAMLERIEREHWSLYGPVGAYRHEPHATRALFMNITEGLSRFILAALSWLEQRVIVEGAGPIERHARRSFERETGQRVSDVKVVQLRKSEHHGTPDGASSYRPNDEGTASIEPKQWSHRWLVDGHWRLQPCGPQHKDRRLTWINPFVKGPDDKPFKAKQTIYEVRR
jgi:hypothetical protein